MYRLFAIRLCNVHFGSLAGPGEHLSPRAFHEEIEKECNRLSTERAGGGAADSGTGSPPLVILDVRNVYETEIGRFDISDRGSVPVIDPKIRKVRASALSAVLRCMYMLCLLSASEDPYRRDLCCCAVLRYVHSVLRPQAVHRLAPQ